MKKQPSNPRIRRRIRLIRTALIAVLAILIAVYGYRAAADPATPTAGGNTTLEVHYIDVGQADCTLVKSGEHAMLIDTADYTQGTAIQSYLQSQNIESLDCLVLTHPDADHIGAAPVIITKFDISSVYMSDYTKENKTYEKLIKALDNKNLKYLTPEPGTQFMLGSATVTILAPVRKYDTPNNASIALLIENGGNSFLFTGDAEEEAEADMLDSGLITAADVLQAGHHGSSTSNSSGFLDAVSPEYVVISCGDGNSYGHPHAETLNTLRSMGVKVFRTDEQGTVVAVSDGNSITWNVPPTESWQSGR